MKDFMAKQLKDALQFELDNLQVEPEAIIMSKDLHMTLGRPSFMCGVNIAVELNPEQHWKLKF